MQEPVLTGFCVVGSGFRSALSQNSGRSHKENMDYNNRMLEVYRAVCSIPGVFLITLK
jgi:hypothetical protein